MIWSNWKLQIFTCRVDFLHYWVDYVDNQFGTELTLQSPTANSSTHWTLSRNSFSERNRAMSNCALIVLNVTNNRESLLMYLLQAIYRHVSNCAQYFMRSHRRARVCACVRACVRRALASCSSELTMQFMYVHLWQTIIIIDHSFHAKVNNNSVIELLLLLFRLYVLLCMYYYSSIMPPT